MRRFCFYWYFVGWDCINFGVSMCLSLPNIEIHLPFGFIRVGWIKVSDVPALRVVRRVPFGIDPQKTIYIGE